MTEPIKLPPMPEWSKMDDLNGFVPSEIRQRLIEYARTAIEADRQARGEPVGERIIGEIKLDAKQHPYAILRTGYDENGNQWEEGTPIYAAPQPQQIPEGYKLVPIEPTLEMIVEAAKAAKQYMDECDGNSPTVIYKAMLEAAPEPKGKA